MDTSLSRPTATETRYQDRLRIVALAEEGWSRPAIASTIGCCVRTVQRWLAAYRTGGQEALEYHSRRPHTPHPLTTAPAVVARIQALREEHPGWGARLIRNQLLLEDGAGVPSERTVSCWLRRLGYPPTPRAHRRPLGWTTPTHPPDTAVWQMDFKEKGGSPTSVSPKATAPARHC